MMNKSKWMRRLSIPTDIATLVTTKTSMLQNEEISRITKSDIATLAKTCTKTVNFNKNKLRTSEINNMRIGNQENTDHLKFKVKLLNIQTCNHKTYLHP